MSLVYIYILYGICLLICTTMMDCFMRSCVSFQIERCNYLLNVFVESARKGEETDGRLLQHLLFNPAEDGGQWHMLVNVIEKHGLVPKKVFPDSWSSENTRVMKLIINNKVNILVMCLQADIHQIFPA